MFGWLKKCRLRAERERESGIYVNRGKDEGPIMKSSVNEIIKPLINHHIDNYKTLTSK